jgi:hypothetical protein
MASGIVSVGVHPHRFAACAVASYNKMHIDVDAFNLLTSRAAERLLRDGRTGGREVGQPGSSSSPKLASATPLN